MIPEEQRASGSASTENCSHNKELLIRHANRLEIAGIIALGVALAVNLLFVTEYVFGLTLAAVAAAAVVGLIALLWFVLPIWIRMTE